MTPNHSPIQEIWEEWLTRLSPRRMPFLNTTTLSVLQGQFTVFNLIIDFWKLLHLNFALSYSEVSLSLRSSTHRPRACFLYFRILKATVWLGLCTLVYMHISVAVRRKVYLLWSGLKVSGWSPALSVNHFFRWKEAVLDRICWWNWLRVPESLVNSISLVCGTVFT